MDYMDFTKDNFIAFCRKIVGKGMSVNLHDFCDGFGYFEMKPYNNESTIRYNIDEISHTEDGVSLSCQVRIGNFHVGSCIVDEKQFLRYAKEISLYGNNDDIVNIYNIFKC